MRHHNVVLMDRSTHNISFEQLTTATQSLQTQVDRDFSVEWGIDAHIIPLQHDAMIPKGYWPIYLVDQSSAGLGVHLDSHHVPYAEVTADDSWTITASHELLEMLADPFGSKLIRGPDIDIKAKPHKVSYLVEVADPCEVYSYEISGVRVSDFVTPEYYNEQAEPGSKLDQLGKLTKPYEVPRGCYISWEDPLDHRWHQKMPNGNFTTAKIEANRSKNPRDDRDDSFGEEPEGRDRHNLPKILKQFANMSK